MKRKQISIAKVAVDAMLIAGMFSACCMWVTAENKKAAAQVHTAQVKEVVTDSIPVVEYAVPYGDTSFKSYMSWKAITNTDSKQYKLQKSCWTDKKGLRRHNNDYVIALGSYYADYIGQRFTITLDTGKTFTAVVGDFKADRHTDESNKYTPMEDGGKNVIEFIVDTDELDKTARKMGDISYAGFKGNVESIERTVEFE